MAPLRVGQQAGESAVRGTTEFKLPRLAAAGQGSSGTGDRYTTPLHETHGTAIGGETTVAYAWHPWSGQTIHLHEVILRAACASARCSLVDAPAVRVQELPVWMLDSAVRRAMRSAAEPVGGLDALTTLAGLLRDAMQRPVADAVPKEWVASPESRGERHAKTPSRSRRQHRQLDLLLAVPLTPDAAPRWSSLPAPTRQALTGLLTRLMEAHAAHAGLSVPRGGADEQ